jgi:hypothetical protein
VQGEANDTMALAKALIADLQDGFGVSVEFDSVAASKIFHDLITGKLVGKVTLPLLIKVDPAVDAKG